jgi:hypothetical protein
MSVTDTLINIPTKTQQDYLDWYADEEKKGLKEVRFFPGNVWQATVDDFIREDRAIDKAIEEGKHSPIPETL